MSSNTWNTTAEERLRDLGLDLTVAVNIAAGSLAERIGAERLYAFINSIGFGSIALTTEHIHREPDFTVGDRKFWVYEKVERLPF